MVLPTIDTPLTERERDIAALIADGLSQKEMADRLKLSVHTIKFHVRNVIAKIGAGSRYRAVAMLAAAKQANANKEKANG